MAAKKVRKRVDEEEINPENKQNFFLDRIILVRSFLLPSFDLYDQADEPELFIKFTYDPGGFYMNSARCLLTVDITYKNLYDYDTGQHTKAYTLKFEFLADFSSDDEEYLEEFVLTRGLDVIWPYANEYAMDQLRRADCGLINIPFFTTQYFLDQITDKVDHKKENVGDGFLRVEIDHDGKAKVWA